MKGSSRQEVLIKAASKGESMSHSYLNDSGQPVEWVFHNVIEVKRTTDDEIGDGAELYARLCSKALEVIPEAGLP